MGIRLGRGQLGLLAVAGQGDGVWGLGAGREGVLGLRDVR